MFNSVQSIAKLCGKVITGFRFFHTSNLATQKLLCPLALHCSPLDPLFKLKELFISAFLNFNFKNLISTCPHGPWQ
jgi:hypothetical protein